MRTKLLTLVILIALSFPIVAKNPNLTFLSPKSLYIYTMASYLRMNPTPEEYNWSKISNYAQIYGIGFTLIRFFNTTLVNFEFDYSPTNYNQWQVNRKIGFYNYKINAEQRSFLGGPLSIYAGIGLSHITYAENELYWPTDTTTLMVDLGLKYYITKQFKFRTDFRFYSTPNQNGGCDFYDEFCFDYYEENLVASVFSIGIEFQFKR